MKKIISLLMLFVCFCSLSMAQAPKAGDIISGTVSDDIEPLMMANVIEIDNNRRIVAHGVTDINGNFSFKIHNPKDKIQVSYIGYQTVTLPINTKHFNIRMKSTTQIQEVVVKATRKTETAGLSIPVTEISVASQTIDMKEFEGLGMTSVDEALQGRISGLDIVANSGNLGAGTTMRLRGVSTIYGNANPLIVVNNNPLSLDDYDQNFDFTDANEEKFAELLNVNPEDIESITVLKDASATAIWGSQGGNGVIEIKTKRGQRGKTRVSYSFRLTGTWQPEGYKLLNGDDYTMYLKEAYFNPELNSSYGSKGNTNYIPEINYDRDFTEYNMYNDNTDWMKAVKQFGVYQQHFVSLMGGGEKANFRISAGYDNQKGSIIKQKLDRFTTRVALDYFVSNRIKVSTNFDLTYTKNHKNYNYNGDLLAIAYQKMPNLSIYEEDANGNDTDRFYTMNRYVPNAQATHLKDQYGIVNPVALAHYAKNDEKSVSLAPEFILRYDILGTGDDSHRLTYEGQVLFRISSNDGETFMPGTLLSANWTSNDNNIASTSAYKSNSLSTRHSITFDPHFNNESHDLKIMLRSQYNSGNSSSQNYSSSWLPTSDIISPLAGGRITGFGTGAGEYKSVNYLLDVHYAYKGKYILHATVRRDGTTRFGPDKRYGTFPGLSARWNITDEKFMEKLPWITMLSIRPSWGIGGNPPGGEGLYYSKYNTSTNYMGEGTVIPTNIRLAALQWEQKEEWNLGFDFGFFNKITGDLSVYTKKTTNLLMPGFNIPSSSGYTQLSNKNAGAMRNNGWEFNLNGSRIIEVGKKFYMDFNITFANNRNEILEMDETILTSMNKDFNFANGSYLSRVQLHNPLGSMYGFRYKGVYQYSDYSEEEIVGLSGPNAPVAKNANGEVILNAAGNPKPMYFDYDNIKYESVGGDAIYEDINHDGNINELDIVYLGSSLPKLTGGFGVKFNYDRWRLNLQFNYRYGQNVINYARMGLESMANNQNQSRAVNWRWHNEGDNFENILPRAATTVTNFMTYNYLGSDRFIEDASYLRLNYAQLSYALSPRTLKKWGLNQLNFALTMNNLFCITKYSGADPEVSQAGFNPAGDNSKTPRSRSFVFSTTISF